jgi:hypothetical protein
MLGVFQQVAIADCQKEIGELATFDLMFEGIRTTLKTQIQSSITTAENHLEDAFADPGAESSVPGEVRQGIQGYPRNMRVLMHSHFDLDFSELKRKMDEAEPFGTTDLYTAQRGAVRVPDG